MQTVDSGERKIKKRIEQKNVHVEYTTLVCDFVGLNEIKMCTRVSMR